MCDLNLCVKMRLAPVIVAKLTEYQLENRWPQPPNSLIVPATPVESTVVFMLSVDSGTGTLKLMGKFLRKEGGQALHDVCFIAQPASKTLDQSSQAHGVASEVT